MSSETANKGLGIFGVVAFGFFILLAVGKCSSGSVAENPERIDQKGVVGTWFDEEGEAEIKVEHNGYSYRLERVNLDGSAGDYQLRREGSWLYTIGT